VVGVDIDTRRVVSRARLNDFAFAGCVDASTGAHVTAMSGGPGDAAGDEIALLDPGARSPRYLRTASRNPTDVAVADGIAVTIHGLLLDGRMVLNATDIRTGSQVATGSVEECTTQMESVGGRVLVFCSNAETSRRDGKGGQLVEIAPRTLAVRPVARPGLDTATIVADPLSTVASPSVLLVGYDLDDPSGESYAQSSRVVRVDLRSGDVLWSRPLAGLMQGAFGGAAADGTLAVLDSSLDDALDSAGIALYSLDTGELRVRLGMEQPSDVAIVGDQVVAVDASHGRLEHVSLDGQRLGETDLGVSGVTGDIDLLPNGYLAR